MTAPGAYAQAALGYRKRGWANPIPVRGKYPPVAGYTGYDGADVTTADLARWSTGPERRWNIALRLPGAVIGVDVDHYDDKHGADTIAKAEADLGTLPPTWSSTSRGPGQPSRIHLFRVPEGLDWSSAQTNLDGRYGPAVDLLHRGWRYAMVRPSIHPQTSADYRWYDPAGAVAGPVPAPADLAELPATWVEMLTSISTTGGTSQGDDDQGASRAGGFDLEAFIAAHLEVARERPWPDDGRRWVLAVCPFDAEHTDESAFVGRRGDGPIVAGCLHASCTWGWAELRRKFAPPRPVFPSPGDPLAVARQLLDADGLRDATGVLTVRWWRGSFYLWTGTHYNECADPAIRARTYHALERADYWKADKDGNLELVAWAPTRRKVGDVLEALQAVVHLPERTDPPAWVEAPGPQDGGRLLALRNGLLHLPARTLTLHSPRLFNLLSLPYDYDRDASQPSRWLEFLGALWPADPDSRLLLQEFFGYVLSGRTHLHKVLLLVGPPRSGKGTIARVLTALAGRDNTAGPTLASLGTNFGLSPLLGKSLAVVSDARLAGPNTFTVVERLLSISGEDALTVDRKYREPWTGRLGVRFMVVSNELPDLGDASGAVASRFATLVLTRSWLGKENHALTEELLAELPGILVWALQGLDRLTTQGHFTEPASSRDAAAALLDMASPVGAFVRDRCELGPAHQVKIEELYAAWRAWCEVNGLDKPGTVQVFGRNLRATAPTVRVAQPRADDDQRERWYAGIGLATESGAARNGSDRVPPRASSGEPSPARDGTHARPMWAPPGTHPSVWRCDRCSHELATDMTGFRHDGCGGEFRGVAP